MSSTSDLCLGWLLNGTSRLMQRRLGDALAPHGLTPTQWYVLQTLWTEDGLSLTVLARRLLADNPTMSTTVAAMEQAGLVLRRYSRNDRRAVLVGLTPKGLALRDVVPPAMVETFAETLSGLSGAQRQHLVEALQALARNLG